ncbi:MAG: hypothetical protein ACLFU7_03365 [Armatimonadota bacterium]
MLRPWLAVLALVGCALIALAVFAWSVTFSAPAIFSGVAESAANVRLQGIAMSLRRQAATMRRDEVRRLRSDNASAAQRAIARHALADELRSAALLAETEGDLVLAQEWMTEAAQAAPERIDLLCLLTDLRTREIAPEERRKEFLLLVYEHDSPCAHLLAAESFFEADDLVAARAYFERAAREAPQWAKPRLALARLDLRAGDRERAREHAAEALARATGLRAELSAAALLDAAGGAAPSRWLLTARWTWRSYACLLPSVAIFVVLVLSPTLVRLIKRGVAAVLSQRGMAESAS